MNAGDILNSTYEIKEKIGSGGGGTVYKAYHKRLKKDVVLKKIHQSTGQNEEEKEILKNLKHSYLPQVIDFLNFEDGVFTIMDYIPGESFEKILMEKKRFSQKKVMKYAIQLCEVVDYLHKQKPPIIHGDIKPANIMLTPQDNICLIDFNISGVLDGESMSTVGYTPGYAAPEQVIAFRHAQERQTSKEIPLSDKNTTEILEETELLVPPTDSMETETLQSNRQSMAGKRNFPIWNAISSDGAVNTNGTGGDRVTYRVDVRADIYSIAATLYHLLTGIRPGNDPDKIVKPSDLDPSIGESISIILMKGLNKDPKKRFQTTENMLNAFQKIHRYNAGYKKMLLFQELTFLAAVLGIGAGILLTFLGRQQIADEKEKAYVQAIAILTDTVSNMEGEQQVEEDYLIASQMKPERLEAYLQKALYLYKNREYEEDIAFIQQSILSEAAFMGQEGIADVYFILGNCYFELEQYEDAIIYYRTAVSRNDQNPDYYRDYVISLVRNGKVAEAEAALADAEKKGISSVDLNLVNGELKKANKDYTGAEQNLRQCILETDDDYLRMRAYVILDMVYREEDTAVRGAKKDIVVGDGQEVPMENESNLEYLLKSQELLEEARTKVGLEYQLLIYERLAQTYIDLQELTSDNSYGEKAISVLQDVIAHGWGTYITYNNISILYQKMGQLENAESMLNQMLEMDPENYNTYKRLAFLEVDKQNQKKNADRRYEHFAEYYKKANELYTNANVAGGDTEMQLLDNLYQQLETGGWLK